MAYPHKWSPISCKSSAGQRKDTGQRPMLYRWTTQPTSGCRQWTEITESVTDKTWQSDSCRRPTKMDALTQKLHELPSVRLLRHIPWHAPTFYTAATSAAAAAALACAVVVVDVHRQIATTGIWRYFERRGRGGFWIRLPGGRRQQRRPHQRLYHWRIAGRGGDRLNVVLMNCNCACMRKRWTVGLC